MDVFKILAELQEQLQLIDETIITFERLAARQERSVSAPVKKKAVQKPVPKAE